MSERAEQLQTAVAQSVSVQEGLKGLLSWLDQLVLNPGPVQATTQAVQDAMTQNQVGRPHGRGEDGLHYVSRVGRKEHAFDQNALLKECLVNGRN